MKRLVMGLLTSLVLSQTALGFDDTTQAFIGLQKVGKPVAGSDLADLMRNSERWCYVQQGTSCAWSDIYLAVDSEGVTYEISNAWSEAVEIAFVDLARFAPGGQICETEAGWLDSVRAISRSDGAVIGGRALHALKAEIAEITADAAIDCFDYRYVGADPRAQTVTLLQRQLRDGVHDPAQDTEVTLQFDAGTADALTLRW